MMTREGVRRIELDEGDNGGVSRMIHAVKMIGMIKAVTVVGII
jgi:hypothetical protein